MKKKVCMDWNWKVFAYLAKLLKAADCGFIQSGTRPVCSCSAINLCISSVDVVGIVVANENDKMKKKGRRREKNN